MSPASASPGSASAPKSPSLSSCYSLTGMLVSYDLAVEGSGGNMEQQFQCRSDHTLYWAPRRVGLCLAVDQQLQGRRIPAANASQIAVKASPLFDL